MNFKCRNVAKFEYFCDYSMNFPKTFLAGYIFFHKWEIIKKHNFSFREITLL